VDLLRVFVAMPTGLRWSSLAVLRMLAIPSLLR
jgi:hypothetical protein